MAADDDHALAFLLAFDGHRHHYAEGYFTKFEIRRVEPTEMRPHGLRYSFTLHGPDGVRLIGFDNAHTVKRQGGRRTRSETADHRHHTQDAAGQPYEFETAEKLVADFFDEVERVLRERGVPLQVLETSQRSES